MAPYAMPSLSRLLGSFPLGRWNPLLALAWHISSIYSLKVTSFQLASRETVWQLQSLWRPHRVTEWCSGWDEGDGNIWCLSITPGLMSCMLTKPAIFFCLSLCSLLFCLTDSASGDSRATAPVFVNFQDVSDWTTVRCWPLQQSEQMFLHQKISPCDCQKRRLLILMG